MAIPSGIVQKRTCVRIRTLGPVIFLGAQAVILAPSRTRPTEQTKQASNDSARRAEAPAEKAWRILHEGLEDANSERRARAVHALGLLAGSAGAEKAAVQGLQDEKPNVRLAAATRSEEHTSELQSRRDLVCRLLLEKKKQTRRVSPPCEKPKPACPLERRTPLLNRA